MNVNVKLSRGNHPVNFPQRPGPGSRFPQIGGGFRRPGKGEGGHGPHKAEENEGSSSSEENNGESPPSPRDNAEASSEQTD